VNAGKLAALGDIKLNLGPSSQTLPGWMNVDGWRGPGVDLVCDLRQRLPFTDGSCHLIFSEHVLEHIDLQFRARVLTEWRRLIAPNGRVRVVVPSSRRATEAYARGDTQWFIDALGVNSRNDGLNNIFNQHFHKYIDDF